MKQITCGVPQGSILGPLLFLLYINDIASVSSALFSILFADDTTLFCRAKSLHELSTVINNELSNVMKWLNANRLSLNIDKTNFMIFRPKGKNEICPSININGSIIKEVDNAKFLGIIIDNKLNWLEHIKCISRKIAKGTGIIIKARKSFETESLLNLLNLIFPHISYCIHVWGTTASIHLHRLYVLQKKIIRIICGVRPRTHTEPLYKALYILNIDQVRDYSIALFMYKLMNHMLPSMFENMFIKTSDVHNYSTRQTDMLYVQYASTKRTQRKHHGTKLWNSLCNSIPADCAISTYKQKLKAFLLTWHSPLLFDASVIVTLLLILLLLLLLLFLLLLLLLSSSDCNPPCTLHSVPVHLILYIPAVYMNMGHISPYFSPHCQSCDCIVLIDNCCLLSWIVYLYDWLIFFVQLWQ